MTKKCIFGIYANLNCKQQQQSCWATKYVFGRVRNFQKRLQTRYVCPSAWNSAPTRHITMKFNIWGFFEKKSVEEKFKFH